MRWIIWTTATHTGDLRDVVGEYAHRGHAIAALRGFRSRAWAAGSEMSYAHGAHEDEICEPCDGAAEGTNDE